MAWPVGGQVLMADASLTHRPPGVMSNVVLVPITQPVAPEGPKESWSTT